MKNNLETVDLKQVELFEKNIEKLREIELLKIDHPYLKHCNSHLEEKINNWTEQFNIFEPIFEKEYQQVRL